MMAEPLKGKSLRAERVLKQMRSCGIHEADLTEQFIRSPGPGGQNVNKVATCVILQHHPSGQTVKCHAYRTQFANRLRARELLAEIMISSRKKREQEKACQRAREAARKRGRSKAGKEKTLDQKKKRASLKKTRARVSPIDLRE